MDDTNSSPEILGKKSAKKIKRLVIDSSSENSTASPDSSPQPGPSTVLREIQEHRPNTPFRSEENDANGGKCEIITRPKKRRMTIVSSSDDEEDCAPAPRSREVRRPRPTAENIKRKKALEDMKKRRKAVRIHLFKENNPESNGQENSKESGSDIEDLPKDDQEEEEPEEEVLEEEEPEEEVLEEEEPEVEDQEISDDESISDDFVVGNSDNTETDAIRREMSKIKATLGRQGMPKTYSAVMNTSMAGRAARSKGKEVEDENKGDDDENGHIKEDLLRNLKHFMKEKTLEEPEQTSDDDEHDDIIKQWRVFRTTIAQKRIQCFCGGDMIRRSQYVFEIVLKEGDKMEDRIIIGRQCYNHMFDDIGVFDGELTEEMRELEDGRMMYLRLVANLRKRVVEEDDLDDIQFLDLFDMTGQSKAYVDEEGNSHVRCVCGKYGIVDLYILACKRRLREKYIKDGWEHVIVGSQCISHFEEATIGPEDVSFLPFLNKFFKNGVTAMYKGKDEAGMHLFQLCGKHGKEIYEKFDVYSEEYDLPFEKDEEARDVIVKVNHGADNRFFQKDLSTESVDEGEKYKVYFKSSVDRSGGEDKLPVLTFFLMRIQPLKTEELTGRNFVL